MVFMQYLSTTVYRYYTKKFILKVVAAFTKRSAIFIRADFRNPKTLSSVDLRNPKSLSKIDMRNPKTITSADMKLRETV